MDAHHILADQRIVPVVVIDSADNAAALATTLLEAGLSAIEVTLRTPAAIDAIARIVKEVPQFLVGAGSVNTCLLYTSPSPRDQRGSRMPSSA